MVFFESSHRIRESLDDLVQVFGEDTQLALCREMTKKFETVLRGSLAEVKNRIDGDKDQRKGEFVLVVAGRTPEADEGFGDALQLASALQTYLPASQAARVAAKVHGVSRRELYAALEQSG